MLVAVTGSGGRAGQSIIPELRSHGFQTVGIDTDHDRDAEELVRAADLRDFGQAVSALKDADAVIHMARSSRYATDEIVFATNVVTTYNVLQAADFLGIEKIVLASSARAMGISSAVPPLYFPVDEHHPTRAQDSYGSAKWTGEQLADGFARRRKVQIASFRIHALWTDRQLDAFRSQPETDPASGAGGFWGYTHVTDCARACRMALEREWEGHEVFFINADDTRLNLLTEEALDSCYPGVPRKKDFPGFQSPIAISKAKEIFGWEPEISWRQEG